MNNTTLLAKSTFSEGLIMDFSPDNSQSSSLTSALNATLLTFNGNELALLNDMGNGRVETAYLPEGYIPVGTCEFGDIIYIVSYNPIKNKSLIGCFPSPERNISSNEIGGTKLAIKASDFQELDDSGNATGKLKATSCKKILYLKDLNPGDKYLISASNLEENRKTITDYGNTSHKYGEFIKLLKIHVVSIEDSGKINYLDSTVKWYLNDFFIAPNKENGEIPDIDSLRTAINSGYSIFQSKVSGKLALLIELEKIKSFSCSYEIYAKDSTVLNKDIGDIEYKNFDVYWYINWESDNLNNNPSYIVLTKSLWSGKNQTNAGKIFYYIKEEGSNKYIIDYDNGGLEIDKSVLPIPFNKENYWYSTIGRLYLLGTYSGSYQSYINYDSYTSISQDVIKRILDLQYSNQLYKINIKLNKDGSPAVLFGESEYYINTQYYNNDTYYTVTVDGLYRQIESIGLTDDIVNNYFKSLICKHFTNFSIPYKQLLDGNTFKPDISNLIYNYAITPAMPYGLLDEFTLEGFIDFSKVGSGEITLTNWKYYNTDNVSTLTIGLDIYPEPNKGVAEVTIDFYDNLGIAATYRISNKTSYSGQFTEYIPLNNSTSNYKLSNISSVGKEIYHAGLSASITDNNIVFKEDIGNSIFVYKIYKYNNEYYYDKNGKSILITLSDYDKIYSNDAGIIYSNIVYLTRITVKYCYKNSLGNYNVDNSSEYKYFDRWYWTNNMFNEYYYNTRDFEELRPVLDLDVITLYSSNEYWNNLEFLYSPEDNLESYLSATVLAINQNGECNTSGNINNNIVIGLQNTYNTFSINKDSIDDFSMSIILGNSYINNSSEDIKYMYSNSLINEVDSDIYPNNYNPYIADNNSILLGVMDNLSKVLSQLLGKPLGDNAELWENAEFYKNRFSINFSDQNDIKTTSISYLNSNLELITLDKTLSLNYDSINSLLLNNVLVFSGIHFSKYYKESSLENKTCDIYIPLLNTQSDLDKYGLEIKDGHLLFKELVAFGSGWQEDGDLNHFGVTLYKSDNLGLFKAPSILTNYYYRKTCPNFGLTKNSAAGIRIWETELNEPYNAKMFKDYFTYNITPVLFGSFYGYNSDYVSDKTYFIKDFYTDHSDTLTPDLSLIILPIYLSSIYNSIITGSNAILPTSTGLGIHVDKDAYKLFLMGLAIKDINNQIHVINNIVSVDVELNETKDNFNSYNITQKVKYNKDINDWGDIYIGDIVGSILSNIYLKSSELTLILVPVLTNVVYLEPHYTQFTLDIIYVINLHDEEAPCSQDLLILGMTFLSYTNLIKSNLKDTDVKANNVSPIILKITKNIPLLINYEYKLPSTILNNPSSISAVVRKNTLYSYLNVDLVMGVGPLYALLESEGSRSIVLLSLINTGTINKITSDNETGYLIYNFNGLLLKNTLLLLIFTYNNNLLTLKRTELNSLELGGIWTHRLHDTICGISIPEYLTESLKCLSR